MPIRTYNPHSGRRLVTINLTGAGKQISCSTVRAGFSCYFHTLKLGRTVLVGGTYGILKAYGFVGRVFQITIEPSDSAQ